jgi:endonuclease/exonuclease/phosphatase family metal-dependent hydrolase
MSLVRSSSKLKSSLLLIALVVSTLLVAPSPAEAKNPRELRFMTRNLYLGASLDPIFAAIPTGNPNALVAAATLTWNTILASNFPARAEEFANELAEEKPDLVGLQEVTLFRTGPFNPAVPATTVTMDFLAMLEAEIAERGLPYAVVSKVEGFDGELPVFTGTGLIDVRLTDRDVILARTDLPTSLMKLSNPMADNFDAALSVPSPLFPGGALNIVRGWTSVDVKSRGKSFRFINTHLEAINDPVQELQSLELLAGPAATKLPVVMLGDFNSDADGSGSDSYANIVAGGFTDAWSTVFPAAPGYTCCHAANLMGPSSLEQRIDIIFSRGGDFRAQEAEIVGEVEADKTIGGLWPSDHAGVLATLGFGPPAGK